MSILLSMLLTRHSMEAEAALKAKAEKPNGAEVKASAPSEEPKASQKKTVKKK